jgi:hypothetical protein
MQGAPDQVHEHHHVAAGFVGKKVKAQIAKRRSRDDGST